MNELSKAERCVTLAAWLLDGESFTISEAAERLQEPYINIWRDIDSMSRVMTISKDEGGRVVLVRLIQR